MKEFVFKAFAIFCIVCFIQALINYCLPTYWGNNVIYEKILNQINFNPEVNTIFIGTSRIHNHIDPNYFDKNTNAKVKSYNFGSPGLAGLESHKIVNNLINNSKNHNINTIYIEMPSFNFPSSKNINSIRAIYFLGLKQVWMGIKFRKERISTYRKFVCDIVFSLKIAFSNCLGLLTFKKKLLILGDIIQNNHILNPDKNRGFVELDRTVKKQTTIIPRQDIVEKFYRLRANNTDNEIKFLTSNINRLVNKAKDQNIRIVYVLMPKMSLKKYVDTYQSFKQLQPKNRLNLSKPIDHPQFYKHNYSSDKVHLNKKGATTMTKEFAKHYNKFNKFSN